VFGESAGSVNAACLLAMSRARGLFRRVILQSGSLNLVRTPEAADGTMRQLLAELGLGADGPRVLRDVPAADLVAAQDRVAGRSVIPPFSPVADGHVIPSRPFQAIAAGSARGVPLIVGTNLEEMHLYRFLDPALDALDDAGLAARCAAIAPGTGPDGRPRAEALVETYRAARRARGDDASAPATWLAIATDQIFRAGALRLAERQASHTPAVYVYEFTWRGTAPGRPQGAVHALDLPFVFGTLDTTEIGAMAGRTPAARALADRMQDAWLAFARTGTPSSAALPPWPPYAAPHRFTMELGKACAVREAPRDAERAIWDDLLPG
jgi:para-nitrobenzyl esterase